MFKKYLLGLANFALLLVPISCKSYLENKPESQEKSILTSGSIIWTGPVAGNDELCWYEAPLTRGSSLATLFNDLNSYYKKVLQYQDTKNKKKFGPAIITELNALKEKIIRARLENSQVYVEINQAFNSSRSLSKYYLPVTEVAKELMNNAKKYQNNLFWSFPTLYAAVSYTPFYLVPMVLEDIGTNKFLMKVMANELEKGTFVTSGIPPYIHLNQVISTVDNSNSLKTNKTVCPAPSNDSVIDQKNLVIKITEEYLLNSDLSF